MKYLRILLIVNCLYGIAYSAMGQINARVSLFDGQELEILSEVDSVPLITINELGHIRKSFIDVYFDKDSIIINNNEVFARSFHISFWTIIDEIHNDVKIKYLEGTTSSEESDVLLLHYQLKDILSKWRFVGDPQILYDIDYYHLELFAHIECFIKI